MKTTRKFWWLYFKWSFLIGILGTGFVLVLMGVFASRLEVQTQVRPVDMIVVFSGGNGERVQKAISLYQAGYAPVVMMSGGAQYHRSEAFYMMEYAVHLGLDPSVIILEEEARSTFENAQFSSEIMLERGVQSMMLVTSKYHTRRSYFWMKQFWDSDQIVVVGADDGVDYSRWWRDYEMAELVLKEMFKYVANSVLWMTR